MKPKLFFIKSNDDTITFTKEELEKLLNDTYEEGYSDGAISVRSYQPIYVQQTQPLPVYYNKGITNTPDIEWKLYTTDENSIGRTILTEMEGDNLNVT